jgi:uncharacterized protein
MNSRPSHSIIALPINPKSLGKVDILAPVSYQGEGFIGLADLPRLQNECSKTETNDGFHCTVQTLSQGERPVMEIRLRGSIHLSCQRCLQPLLFELDQKKRFVFVKTEEEADEFPLDNEEEEAMVASHAFDLLEAIEDEVLLAIPYAPKHPTGKCQLSQEEGDSGRPNPFKVLKSLKK